MQRWEYRVVSLRDGHYTSTLNELGQEGWELVAVCQDAPPPEPAEQPKRGGLPIPIPGAIGRLEDAASAIGRLSGGAGEQTPDAGPTGLLWVLKRPLAETS